jgi:orotidine-5'-phosphate decarboxylase
MTKYKQLQSELPWKKLIVALDLEDKKKINQVVDKLAPKGVKFKIGSIAFTKFGPVFVKRFIDKGIDIFLDLKLYDIPNTMKKTAAVITELGCWAFTVHIKAGEIALREVKQEVAIRAKKLKLRKPLILGVSELTSEKSSSQKVLKLIANAKKTGLDGVIASPQEVYQIKKQYDLKVVTPGIRSPEGEKGDQKRIATAQFAFNHGADYIVVGRPIINEKDYLKAAKIVLEAKG